MPRQSAAALSVVHFEPSKQRPEPPDNLSCQAAKEWRYYVNSMPANWFPKETHALLCQLCCLTVRAKAVSRTLDKAEEEDPKAVVSRWYLNLMRTEIQLSDAVSRLMTKMRLTQQCSDQYDKGRKRNAKKEVPWDQD